MGRIQRQSRDCVDSVAGWNLQPSLLKRTARNPKTRSNPHFCPSVYRPFYTGPTSRLALVGVKIGAGMHGTIFLLGKHFLKPPLNHKPGLKIELTRAPHAGEHGSFMSAQSVIVVVHTANIQSCGCITTNSMSPLACTLASSFRPHQPRCANLLDLAGGC